MSNPFYQEQENQPALLSRLAGHLRARLMAASRWLEEKRAQKKQVKQLRKERRQAMRENAKKPRWPGGISEKFYMLLDYDPTDSESGETGSPSIIGAILQWSYRVLWTQRIEIFGLVLLIVVGTVCYSAVSSSNDKKKFNSSRIEQVQPDAFEVTSR